MTKMRGSISVFMVFVLAILLAASGTLLEGSRYYAVRTFSKTSLKQAGNSIMTEYYRPLFEQYHLLFLAMSTSDSDEQKELLSEKATQYIEYSINPNKDINDTDLFVNLIMPSIKELTVEDIVLGTDSNTEVFEQEVSAYMKYKSLDSILDKLLSKFEFAKSIGQTATVLEKKVKTEQSMGELSTTILEIMELVEGISVNSSEIEMNSSNNIATNEIFAKKYVYEDDVNQQNTGISQQEVWTSLKSKYINVDEILDSIEKIISSIDADRLEIQKLQQEELDSVKEEDGDVDKKKDIKSNTDKIDDLEKSISDKTSKIKSNLKSITKSLSQVEAVIKKAIGKINSLETLQQDALGEVTSYREVLDESSDKLGESVYGGLNEDCSALEGYVGMDESSEINKIKAMSSILSNNLSCLQSLETLKQLSVSGSESNLSKVKTCIEGCRESMNSYSIRSLQFNYSSASFEECKNPISSIKELMSNSILELVVKNTSEVSGNELSKGDMLVGEYLGESTQNTSNMTDILKNLSIENLDISEIFSQLIDEGSFDIDSLTNIAKPFLINQYINECFLNYTAEQTMEQALFYEQEYILYGNKQDEENLKESINTLMIWRTVLNFLGILSDHDKGNTAYATAAALVGFTGIEPLVRVMKFLILIAWSFAESLVDVAVLLGGKEIQILKSGSDFSIEYTDLFTLSKEIVQAKAAKKKDLNGAGMSYGEWMDLFLLLKNGERQNYRIMDLITENMRLRYDTSFSMKNTIYSFSISADFQAKYRFAVFAQQKDFFKSNRSFWSVNESVYNSYS